MDSFFAHIAAPRYPEEILGIPFGFKLHSVNRESDLSASLLGDCPQLFLNDTAKERDLVAVVLQRFSALYHGVSGSSNCT